MLVQRHELIDHRGGTPNSAASSRGGVQGERGVNRPVVDAIVGVVEAMHYNVAAIPGLIANPKRNRTTGITGLVYRSCLLLLSS